MKSFLFLDLDGTIFQSQKKCGGSQDLAAAAFLNDGSAHSFTTPKQRRLLEIVRRDLTIIPTTARNYESFRRVSIEFSGFSILNHGGVIFSPQGINNSWHTKMVTELESAIQLLHGLRKSIEDYASRYATGIYARIISDFGQEFYLLIKDKEQSSSSLLDIEINVISAWLAAHESNFYVHVNDNNLAILPRKLNKRVAVEYLIADLIDQHGEILSFGMGDSYTDAGFLSICDFALVPSGSQLATRILELA